MVVLIIQFIFLFLSDGIGINPSQSAGQLMLLYSLHVFYKHNVYKHIQAQVYLKNKHVSKP